MLVIQAMTHRSARWQPDSFVTLQAVLNALVILLCIRSHACNHVIGALPHASLHSSDKDVSTQWHTTAPIYAARNRAFFCFCCRATPPRGSRVASCPSAAHAWTPMLSCTNTMQTEPVPHRRARTFGHVGQLTACRHACTASAAP